MRFRELMNRHEGETVYVIGSGPSLDALDPETMGDSPRVVLTRLIHEPCAVPVVADKTYWVYLDWMDPAECPWWRTRVPAGVWEVTPYELLDARTTVQAESGARTVHFRIEREHKKALAMSREECAESETLYGMAGSGVAAAHLAWYLGAGHIVFAGIDGGGGNAELVRDRYGEHFCRMNYSRQLVEVKLMLERHSLPHTFLEERTDG